MGYCSRCGGRKRASSYSLCSYCRADLKERHRKEWMKNRIKAFDKVMGNHPGGITKDNLEQIKQEVKTEEKSAGK